MQIGHSHLALPGSVALQSNIIIVNYRTSDLAVACLRSLAVEASEHSASGVVVVDNASGDESVSNLGRAIWDSGYSNWASLLPLFQNAGYAAGNNAGVRLVLTRSPPPEYVLLLNPDTIVRPGAIETLVQFMDKHPRVGIAGSRLEDPDGTPQRSAFRFPTVLGELEGGVRLGPISRLLSRWVVAPPVQDQPHLTDWVAGASFIIRRRVFDDIGMMDEGYFLYFEETDFCLRAKRAGWECWYVPASRVVHLVGQSTGLNSGDQRPRRRPAYWFEARRRYFVKNHGWLYAALADLAWAVGFALWRARRCIQRKPDTDPPHMLLDFVRHSVWLRGARL